jgi:hypothetical protein
MPYGTISASTREYVESRAAESNISFGKLGIDESEEVTISVIYSGALDEEFDMSSHFAINVADWIAEDLARMNEPWTVTVTQYGDEVYRTASNE